MKAQNIGSSFADFLSEEGMLDGATVVAVKRLIGWQIAQRSEASNRHNGQPKTPRKDVARTIDFPMQRTKCDR